MENDRISDDLKIAIERVAQKRVFFGHMSVGHNILEGIEKIIGCQSALKLNFINSRDPNDYHLPGFGHFKVGINKFPISKIEDFADIIESGLGEHLDCAFFKFCYTDIRLNTDLAQLFNFYKDRLHSLEIKFPHIRFLHFTVPVMIRSRGIKGLAKDMLKHDHNESRNRLSQMIRDHYETSKVFDIERIESTFPDQRRRIYRKKIYGLVPAYTYDDGHLNSTGAMLAGKELLFFLSHNLK